MTRSPLLTYPTIIFSLVTFFIVSLSCPLAKGSDEKNPDSNLSIIILPSELPFDKNYEAKISPDNMLEEGRRALQNLLSEYSKGLPNARVMSDDELAGKLIDIHDSRRQLARKIAAQTTSDAVMISTIKKYIRRDAAQSRPATVAFDYQLIEAASGEILCSGSFDETQQPLSDNILSFSRAKSRNFKWISAIELANEGLEDKLNKCLYLQRNESNK